MEVLTEIVRVIVEEIVGYTITAVGRQMGYLIRYKKNVDNLKSKVVDLEDTRADVQRKVQAASYNVEEIEAKVQTWLTRVQGINTEVQEFFKEEGQAKLMCFNLKARYQFGRKAHKMGLTVKELKDTADTFHTVGHRVHTGEGTTISTKGYEDFGSRKSTLNGIMRALKDDSIRAIGVYGMGGVGKTMLVGKIATQAKEDDLFESIVKVVVSQTPDLEKIQKDIAEELRLSFQDRETDSQKADLLRERLKKGKILLIIDDIWDKIDLESRGISFGDDQKGSKLLLTSRSEDVLGEYTDPQGIFQVEALSTNEAEFLFVKIVGNFETLDLQSIMVELVEECAGLPIAITTVANALKSQKDPKVWKDAVGQLKRANPTQIKDMLKKVYSSIKLSYDFLTKEAQSLFLFCSIFEEDKVIEIDHLWRYLVGLDFFEDVYKMEEVRNRVHTLVNSLKDSCLLLEGGRSGTFKMHDVIRDVAIYIADKEEKMLTIRSLEGPEKWLNIKKWKDSFGIALFDVDFKELPERLECQQLKFIFLVRRYFPQPIPSNVFEGMKELRVLVLIDASLLHLSSISCLHNLRSLFLDRCGLEDVALIGELKNLRALTLSNSNIKQLPMEIRQLTRLQLFNLNNCTQLKVIPSNVFSDLRRLEELYMNCSFNKWHVDGEITERNNTMVSELNDLPFLTALYIHIPNPKILPEVLLFEKLQRYEILIGNDEDDDEGYQGVESKDEYGHEYEYEYEYEYEDEDEYEYEDGYEEGYEDEDESEEGFEDKGDYDYDYEEEEVDEISRTLKLRLHRGWQIEDGIKVLLKSCEYLDLTLWNGFKNILYKADKEGFPQLKHLYVQNSTEIQYIVNFMEFQCVAFPVLQLLSLDNMKNLEEICHDQVTMGSFLSLKKLRVSKCEKLTFVSSLTKFGCFSLLQEIVIKDCEVMRAIFSKEGTHEIQVNHDTNIIDFNQLRSLYLQNLPNLMGFHPDADSQLLFNEKVAFSNLEKIYIEDIDNLKMLWHNHQLDLDSFCKIKELHVYSCKNLMNIFPPNMLRRLQNLEELTIEDCSSVEEVFEVRGENVDEICEKGSTQLRVLRDLTLISLPKLKHVWVSDLEAILTFQNLRQVEVSKCKTLKSLFLVSVAKSLEQLESLCINDCELMEEIVALEEGLETLTKFVFPRITSLTLQSLPKLKCFYPGKHTLEWLSLKSLTIAKCDKVKIVASNGLSFIDTDELGDHVPVQQPLFLIEKVAFSNLETIIINGIDNLKMLWHNQLVFDSICKIKKLHVGSCKNLMNIFPHYMLRRLQNLEELMIKDCNSVEEVFEVKGENVDEICDKGSTQLRVLRHLTLINLPKLMHVWTSDPEAILTFQNLRQVKVSKCKTMKSLFPVSVAKSLEQLESIHINDCELMEEIVALEEGLERMTKFVFSKITSLTLELLPELKCFYPRKHTSEWPSLKSLTISKCDKVKIVASNELNFTETDELGNHVPVQQPLFLIEKVAFFNLETIIINGIDNLKMLWQNQLVSDSICKIKKLHVGSCKNLMNIFPPNMLRRLQNLEELKIEDCNAVEEVFEVRGENVDEICDKGSTQLRRLTLINLPKLKHVWTSNPEAILTFQNLHQVKVSKCKTLKSLFPVSVAKSLEQLDSLDIYDCGLMKEIVALEEELEMTKFVFPRITSLSLRLLPKLKCFYQGKHTSKWPSLKSLTISKCDKVKIVALNELSFTHTDELGDHVPVQQPLFLNEKDTFPNLKELDLDLNETMNQTNGRLFGEFFCKLEDLNMYGKDDKLIAVPSVFVEGLRYLKSLSVTNLFFDNEGQYAGTFERLTKLYLYKMPKLMLLWKENSEQGRAFQNLENLTVSECGRLKNLVPSSMCFRNLYTLRVWKCHGLISLATSSTVKNLVQLKELDLSGCKRMREIVTNEGEGEAGDEICFNQLKYLYLYDLPSLRSFHLGNRTIKFPSLEDLIVGKCPEMKIFSNGVLSMPKLKIVGLDENNRWWAERRELLPEEDVNSAIKRCWEENYDPCVQLLFTEKTDASTSDAGEKNGVDNLEDDLNED